MSAADDVKKAWTVPGVNPSYYRREKARVRECWPVLAQAIEKLVREPVSTEAITDEPAPSLPTREQIAKYEELLAEWRTESIGVEMGRYRAVNYGHLLADGLRGVLALLQKGQARG